MNNDCNHNKCQCNSDKCGISLKTIPAALGDDTGEFKPENGAYCNTFVKYEANGAQYFYSKDGIFSKVAEIPGYVKQQSDFAETNEESPAFIKNKELVATAEQLEAEATARAEQDEFLHNENVSLGNELNAEKNARIQKDTELDNAINTKASKAELQTETSARQSAIQAEATARQNADQALSDRMDAFTGMDYVVVDQLPTVGEKGKVYLVPKQGEHPDVHNEFIWVNGQWELIGSTQMDLTDYVKRTDYATSSTAGVVRDANCFLTSNANGGAYAEEMSFNSYNVASGYNFIGKGTLENVLNGRKYLMPEYVSELPATGSDNKLYLTPAEEQPDIEATASGKEIEITDASEGDLIDWTIKGDTEQASYTGKNLLNYTGENYSGNGITITNNGGNTFTYNGALTAGFNYTLGNCSLKAGKTYTASLEVLGGSVVQYYVGYLFQILDNNNTSNFSASIGTTKKSVQFTPTADATSLRFWHPYNSSQTNESFSNFKFRLQIEEGSSATDFEPYVGGTPSPSPDYPQEVKTVTGRQTVSIIGKNLFNVTDEHIEGSIHGNTGAITEYSDFTLEISEGKIKIDTPTSAQGAYRGYISKKMYLDNGTYSLSFNRGEDVGQYVAVFAYDKSDTFISRLVTLDTATKTMASFTKADNVAYVRIAFETSAKNTVINFSNIQLEKGSKTSYQPYSGQEVELNLGKNLFDNAKVANAMTGSASGSITVTPIATGFTLSIGSGVSPNMSASATKLNDNFYTKIEPNTTYTLSFDTNFTSSGAFLIGYSYDASTNKHIKVISDTNQTKVTFNIPYDNIVFRFASGTDVARTFSNIQIERGDKATEYAPYFEPIELCKLGDYQDRIFKDGDTWKIEKNVEKSTFNGSENWFKSGASTADIFIGALNIYDLGFRLPYEALYRHNIASNLGKQTSDTVVGKIDIYNQTSGFFAYVNVAGTTTYASDIATFKAKLAENNMQFYYLLTEPQVIEITYQPLIDQLNALETLMTVKGYNRITTDTPSVQPFLEFGYFRPDPTVTKDEWLWVENHYEQIGSHRWGSLTGNISDQHDLKHELDSIKDSVKSKVDKSDNSLVRSDEATKLKVLTQAQYDALTPAADTIYFIKEA